MTSGGRRVVLLVVVSAVAVAAAAAGCFSPPAETASAPGPTATTTTTPPSPAPSTGAPTTTVAPTTVVPTTVSPPTTTAATTTTTAPMTTTDPDAPRSLSILLTGDIVPELPVLEAGRRGGAATGARFDFTPVLAPIAPLVQSYDLAICQMEVPLGRPGEEPGSRGPSPFGGNRLVAPYELGAALQAAGFDRCTTASNHSNDVGDAGIVSTIDVLESLGMSWSGTARAPDELPHPLLDVRGVRLAHLSYARRSNTEWPADSWRVAHTNDPADIARDVASARAAGAELVIVSLHVFKEMTEQPIAENRAFAEAIVASSDVDAIIHHGPHVVQPFELVDGTPVWWSIGNLLTGMARPGATGRYEDPRTRDGLGAVLRFRESTPGQWLVEPSSVVICNESASRTIHAGVWAAQDPGLDPALRSELQGCVERTRVAVPDAG